MPGKTNSPTSKACSRCHAVLPLTTDYFQRSTGLGNGFKSACKPCAAEQQRARRVGRSVPAETVPVPAPAATETTKWSNVAAFDAGHDAAFDVSDVPPVVSVVTQVVKEVITHVEEHRLKQKVRELEAERKSLIRDLSDAQAFNDVARAAEEAELPVDPIRPRETLSGLREATALAMASDWHIEEEVKPEQVNGRNRYNLEISARRMERFFEATRWAIQFNRTVFTIRDLVLWLGGDLITNYLHDDNIETNLLSPPEAIAYAQASIVAGIRYLLEDPLLERIVIPCNDGNHGRMTDKTRSASRTAMSLEIMLYRMIQREFADEPRVEFIIAGGEHLYYEVYGRTIRFTHGDTARYGGGVGGIMIPILKAVSRWDTVRRADMTCLGHFHQRTCLPDLMVNGSLIGYSPYSLTIGARFEQPSQNFSILEPARFRSVDLPLWVGEREDDDRALS